MSVEEVARSLRRNSDLVRRWLREGRLRGRKFGRDWFISEGSLAVFKSAQPRRRKKRQKR